MDIVISDGREQANVIPLRFWIDYEADADGGFREIERVEWTRKGSNGATTSEKIVRVRKDGLLWPVIERFYDHWKKGQEPPVNGTPLAAWPGISPEQAGVLKTLHLTSVEDFAGASDGILVKLNIPGIRRLQQQAKAFLSNQDRGAAAAQLIARDERIAFLETQLEELSEMVKTLAAKDGEPKRGPGRPPKVREEAA